MKGESSGFEAGTMDIFNSAARLANDGTITDRTATLA